MACWKQYRWLVAVIVGAAGGWATSGLWPQTPVHATATDRIDTFGMATGEVQVGVEAVYFLDFLTGDLQVRVLGENPKVWSGFFWANVSSDLGIDPQKNPKFLITTGVVHLRHIGGSRFLPSNAICFVAEVTTGRVAAYAIPWSASMYAANQAQSSPLWLVGLTTFRQATGPGPAGSPAALPAAGGRKARAP
jgi:hypothetical protein